MPWGISFTSSVRTHPWSGIEYKHQCSYLLWILLGTPNRMWKNKIILAPPIYTLLEWPLFFFLDQSAIVNKGKLFCSYRATRLLTLFKLQLNCLWFQSRTNHSSSREKTIFAHNNERRGSSWQWSVFPGCIFQDISWIKVGANCYNKKESTKYLFLEILFCFQFLLRSRIRTL